MHLDWVLFQALNSLAGRWAAADRIVELLMNDYALPTVLSALLVVLWFRGRTPGERRADHAAVIHTIVALIVASAVVKLLNLCFVRPRPFADHEGVRLLFYHPSDSSLPSNSVTVAFVLAVGAAQRSVRLGVLGVIMGLLLGLSRVVGGVHYPLDILAGALLGTAAVLLVSRSHRILSPLVQGIEAIGRHVFLA